MRERQAAEAAGRPPPAPPTPDEIPYHQHVNIIAQLKREYSGQIAELRARLVADGKVQTSEEAKALIEEASKRFDQFAAELRAQLEQARADLEKVAGENAELRAQLEQARAPAPETGSADDPDPKAKTGPKRGSR